MRIRRIDLTFTALLLPLDIMALFAAGLGAYALRFSRFVTEVRPILQDVNFENYIKTVAIFVGATLTATSVGITARVLGDLGRMDTPEARIILGASAKW
mgnify:CR=1 FL=1